MKVSIWQQFSSNHSSSFTVIGEFATHDDAERAASSIRAILRRIQHWHEEHLAEMDDRWRSGDWIDQPFPIEEEIGAEYNVEWKGGIDWMDAEVEVKLDRLVFIHPHGQTDALGAPFDQIMVRLGGKGYHDTHSLGGDDYWTLFDLTCTAPDEMTADAILLRYLGFHQRVMVDGRHIHFKRWHMEAIDTFPELIADLQARGCKDIAYTFTQFDPASGNPLHDASDIEVLIKVLTTAQWDDDRTQAAKVLITFLDVTDTRTRATIEAALHELGYKP